MTTYENTILMQRKQGNDMHIDYPVTRYANVLDAPTVYNSFAEVNASYTGATSLRTVLTAMANNSVLRVGVTKNNDYPDNGNLELVKLATNKASCTLMTAESSLWTLSITNENIEQIFGRGGIK